jgi:hypothetical protein
MRHYRISSYAFFAAGYRRSMEGRMRKARRIGLGLALVLSCAALLVACAGGEPPTPAPVIMGTAPAPVLAELASPAIAAPIIVTPTRSAPKARAPATRKLASKDRNRPVLVRAAHWKAVLDAKLPSKARHIKLASAQPNHRRATAARTVPLDAAPATPSRGKIDKSATAGAKPAWISPRPAPQPTGE